MSRYQNSRSTFDDVTSILRDESFWRLADHAVKLVGPVDQSLAAFERDTCCITLVYEQFEWMQTHSAYTLPASRQDATLQRCVLNKIGERRGFVCDETVSIAYFLDQTKRLSGCVEEEIIDIIDFATKLATRLGLLIDSSAIQFHRELVTFAMWKKNWSDEEQSKHIQFNPLDCPTDSLR